MHKTTNSGDSWSKLTPSGLRGSIADIRIHPTNTNNVALATSDGFYSSTNGGSSFSKVVSGINGVNNLYQSEQLGGLVVCAENGMWLWKNWRGEPVLVGVDSSIPNVNCAIDASSNCMYAGTSGGSVWRAYDLVGIADENDIVSTLGSVYVTPNPVFSSAAELLFSLPAAGYTTVTVYDVSGRTVEQVSSCFMDAGQHEVLMNTIDYSSGIYYSVIQNEEFSMSAKFVIMK